MGCFQSKSKTGSAGEAEQSSPPRKSMGTALGTSMRALRDRIESLDPADDRVVHKKEQLMAKQKKEMFKSAESLDKVHDWELVFDEMSKAEGKLEFTAQDLNHLFMKIGIRINMSMLNLLFNLFDANNNGTVDKSEFVTAAFFLSQRSTAHDTIDLAFRLFDSNLSGGISKEEFAEMAISLMVKASFLLAIPSLRKSFRTHLEAEKCSESLDFFEAVEQARFTPDTGALRRNSSLLADNGMLIQNDGKILVKDARRIADEFIQQDSPKQVNLSEKNRETVLAELNAETDPNAYMSSKGIDKAILEIVNLLETDAMPRFQKKVKDHKIPFVDEIWKEQRIPQTRQMNKRHFRDWANSNPGVFSFLDDLRRVLSQAEAKQKVIAAQRIQRVFRKHLATTKKKRDSKLKKDDDRLGDPKISFNIGDETTDGTSVQNKSKPKKTVTFGGEEEYNGDSPRRLSIKVAPNE